MKTPIFLTSRAQPPTRRGEGQTRARAKAERVAKAYERYYRMLKREKEKLEKLKPKEEKAPRVKRVQMPVVNPEEVLEAKRLSGRG